MNKLLIVLLIFFIGCNNNKILSETYYNKGYSYFKKGSYTKSDKFLQKSLNASKDNYKALYLLLKIYYKNKNDTAFNHLISKRIELFLYRIYPITKLQF